MPENIDLEELLAQKNYSEIRLICESKHPAKTADLLSNLPSTIIWKILLLINFEIRTEIFSYLPMNTQIDIAETLKRKELAQIFTEMSSDDRTDLFKQLPKETQDLLMPGLAHAEREDLIQLSSYPEKTAGSVMTSEYITLFAANTVAEALNKIRREGPDKETIYYAYIIKKDRTLEGFVSLKDLLLVKPEVQIEKIMQRDLIFCSVKEDQEDVAHKIQKYGLLAIPVVDENNFLVGIITHDDALYIITQEQTEDFEKFMAISGNHEAGAYFKKSSLIHFKDRAFWIISLAVLGLVSGMIIHSFEKTLMQFIVLIVYMPMIANTGGTCGSQAATVIIRAIALKEVSPKDAFRVLFKELKIAIFLSIALGMLTYAKVLFLSHGVILPHGYTLLNIAFAVTVGLSLQVVTSTVFGASLPMIAHKLKLDPALIASPVLTTCVDISGLLIYFFSAKIILGI